MSSEAEGYNYSCKLGRTAIGAIKQFKKQENK